MKMLTFNHPLREKYCSATLVILDHAFGLHATVSAFDGEMIATFMVSGGHQSHHLVTIQRCDTPIDIRPFTNLTEAAQFFLSELSDEGGEWSLRTTVSEHLKIS